MLQCIENKLFTIQRLAMHTSFDRRLLLASTGAAALLLVGCGSAPKRSVSRSSNTRSAIRQTVPSIAVVNPISLPAKLREEAVMRTILTLDTPYRYGGNTPEGGFDCSGLMQYALSQITNRPLPRTTQQWASVSRPVGDLNALRRGDFVFFNTTGRSFSHMGLFVGNGEFIHAPSSGGTVRKARIDNVYWAPRFDGGRTVFA